MRYDGGPVRRRVWAVVLASAGVATPPLGWVVSDRLESDSRFCVACHRPDGARLHGEKFEEFTNEPVTSLVAAHRSAEPEFRCIDCHGGTGPLGRLRVKTVAARDAVRYLLGAFHEPDRMRHPLWDEDCASCHTTYRPERDDAFHAFAVHNVDLPHPCVECHVAHASEGSPDLAFLSREVVLPVCRNCHEEF